jgi:serine protease Do
MKKIFLITLAASLLFGFEIQVAKKHERITPKDSNLDKIISFSEYLDRAINSVVSIFITANNSNRPIGAGSGVVISKDGYIVTNAHVAKKALNMYVNLNNSKKKYKAKIIGMDESSDLAIIKINTKNLKPIKFANSENIHLTDLVFTIGNGFGLGTTVSMGIVSAIHKRSLGIYEYENLIQTDATINPGNCGGALVNNRGELIGINSAAIFSKSGGSNGVGFAIPSNTVKIIATSLIEQGKFERGYFGASFGLKNDDQVFIDSIDKASSAYKAGLRTNDIIISVDGMKIDEVGDMIYLLGIKTPGDTINVKYKRGTRTYTKEIKLTKRPQ